MLTRPPNAGNHPCDRMRTGSTNAPYRTRRCTCCSRCGGSMSLHIGSVAPDFEQDSTQGRIHFHAWLGSSWGVLFSHPKDFTPVCTTELGRAANLAREFAARGVK